MALQLPPSGGDRSAPRVRVRVANKNKRGELFTKLMKFVEFIESVLRLLNNVKDLFMN